MAVSETSAGVVLFRRENGERLYLLLYYLGGHWSFVKGRMEEGESEEETTRRELEEETGITDLRILPDFREMISYFYKREGETVSKEVVYLLGETEEEDVELSHEHQDYDWLPYDEAVARLTYENSEDVLEKAEEFLQSHPTLEEWK